jgi:hypothetical protein
MVGHPGGSVKRISRAAAPPNADTILSAAENERMKPLRILAYGKVPVDVLEAAGHAVLRADTLTKAVATAEETSPDLLVHPAVDPAGDGPRLARMLAWVRGTPAVEVVDGMPSDGLLRAVRAATTR